MKINNTFKFIISLIIPQLAGGLGSYFTIGSVKDWYPVLVKPALNPPAWIFGPVWTTLFLLMGYALYLVWKDESGKSKRLAYWAFGIQMVLNALWSIIFFGLHSPGGALVEMVFLWLAILATIVAFAKISKPAAWLLVPYILWVSFAGYLNFSIWTLNRDIPTQSQSYQQEAVINRATNALKAMADVANEISGITSGAVFTFEVADTDGHFANFGLVRYVNEVKAEPAVEEHAVTFREIGEGSSGNAEVDSATGQVISMHRRTMNFGDELSSDAIEQRARQFLERVYPDFKIIEPTLTVAVNMKGARLNNGNYFFRWDDLNYKNTLPDGIHTDVDPFVQVGITASGFIFSYDNTIDLYRNAKPQVD